MSFKAKHPANKTGRPLVFKSPQEMWDRFLEYKDNREKEKDRLGKYKPLTVTGMLKYLGINSPQTFYNYEERPEFLETIAKIRMEIMDSVIDYAFEGDTQRKTSQFLYNIFFEKYNRRPPTERREPVKIVLQDKRKDREIEVNT